jgi:hypothetical protein
MAPYKQIVDLTCLDCLREMPAGTWIVDSCGGQVHYGTCPPGLRPPSRHIAPEVAAQMQAYRLMVQIPGQLDAAIENLDLPIEELVKLAEAAA